jgi:hypothetical protein
MRGVFGARSMRLGRAPAAGQFSAGELPSSVWDIMPDPVGPFDAPAAPGTVSTGMVAHTRRFDLDASPDNGDFEQTKVDPMRRSPASSTSRRARGAR